eukprot:CAMPEP_0203654984 /NCGR_PEP_ID=MMETSP0088-20131115/36837_1 /ASSEMBLY_ACC=CAM_ASM_001087 /TAXON_ID=426623 /ORGANISM="Chaetoceros affinis, Strain CCMP159" /LENGTH=123 /DNA_ID=CAMNT_0050515449 /DNA_START=21 /DNA_END=392 /DNA_ORIENTATION=-
MKGASNTPPLHVLRTILRHIQSAPKQSFPKESSSDIAVAANDNPLGRHVLQQYKLYKDLSPTSTKSMQLRKMAYDYAKLNIDLKERARLHELDGGAEIKLSPKELSRRAAARAGLQLPEESTA